MKYWVIIFFLFGFYVTLISNNPIQFVKDNRVAFPLQTVAVYPDSSFFTNTNSIIKPGTLVEVIGKSGRLHYDEDQKQQFFWYKIKTRKGDEGWVFGGNLAISMTHSKGDEKLKNDEKRIFNHSRFGEWICWEAEVSGRDFTPHHGQKDLSDYRENYFVLTHISGMTIFTEIKNFSERGRKEIVSFKLVDLTFDDFPEVCIETNSISNETHRQTKKFTILKAANRHFEEIFYDVLTLDLKTGDIPIYSKHIKIDGSSVRIEHIEWENPKKALLYINTKYIKTKNGKTVSNKVEHLVWNGKKEQFESIFDKFYLFPKIRNISNSAHTIYDNTSMVARKIGSLKKGQEVDLLMIVEKNIVRDGKKYSKKFYLIRLPNQKLGYVQPQDFQFVKSFFAPDLNYFFYPEFFSDPNLRKRNYVLYKF